MTYRSPHDHAARHLLDGLVGHLEDDALVLDLLDHGLRHDVDLGLLERRLGVVDQLFAEHREHGRQSLMINQRDFDVIREFRVPRAQVVLEEVVKLTAIRSID